MSKFNHIYHNIKRQILDGSYSAGDFLPSETEYTRYYNVSRETLRKALNLLVEQGFIQKIRGRGSVVLDVRKYDLPITGLVSYKELDNSQQIGSKTTLIKNEKITIPTYVANALNVSSNSIVHHIIRIRSVEGVRIVLDEDYILADIIESIPDKEAEHSLYRYFEKDLDLQISYARKEFTVDPIRDFDRESLDIHKDNYVVVVRSAVYLEDTTPFQYTESRHRIDKFRFVDFARRKPIN